MAAQRGGLELRSTAVVIAQVWRDPAGRQARLGQLLKAVDVRSVDQAMGRDAGVLLGRAGLRDAVDATVVAVSAAGDRILTSDPDDIGALVAASGRSVLVVPC
jgi:predicted nuclease of predicted toxin-antitoxin system